MRDINRELLQLAGFEGEDLENFLPRWLETAKALQLTDEKVAYAVDHYIPENWDIKYLGVRKTIGAYLREANEICHTKEYKEKGVKIVYGILPAIANYYYAIKEAGGDKVYIGFPDLILVNVLNAFFHAAAPFLNKAEEAGFSYGCRHCPLNKMRLAAYIENVGAGHHLELGLQLRRGPQDRRAHPGHRRQGLEVSRLPRPARLLPQRA